MPADQSALRRTSLFILSAGGFLLIVGELLVAVQLLSKRGLHEFNFGFYCLPFLLFLPLIGGLALRQRVGRWEASGEMSAAASAQINLVASVLVLFSYLLFMIGR